MQFRTEVFPNDSDFQIDFKTKILFLGSCFATNIKQKMTLANMDAHDIQHGVLFNPHSINQALCDLIGEVKYTESDLQSWDGKYYSMNHSGSYSDSNVIRLLDKINDGIEKDAVQLQNTEVLVVTLGSAWVYRHFNAGIVANCHRIPSAQFVKEKLGVNDIVSQFSRTLEHLFCVNSNLKVIFSLSPVRHWKDGAIENQWSKSILNVAIHEIIRRFNQVSYFPAYELIMDDLRDYRFFKEDLLHPNQMAINYIWEKFQRTYFSEETSSGVQKVEKWKKGMNHRVLGDKTDRMNHLSKLIESAVILENELMVDLSTERQSLNLSKSQLS